MSDTTPTLDTASTNDQTIDTSIGTTPDQNESTTTTFHSRTQKTPEELIKQQEVDSRSIYIGNVDYKSSTDDINDHFNTVGEIIRVTILYNRFTGHPKGYAYVEYQSKDSVTKAVEQFNNTKFKDRIVSVVAKRTNLPGFRPSYSRGGFRNNNLFRGRGGSRGGSRGRGGFNRGGYSGRGRGDYGHGGGYGREDSNSAKSEGQDTVKESNQDITGNDS